MTIERGKKQKLNMRKPKERISQSVEEKSDSLL